MIVVYIALGLVTAAALYVIVTYNALVSLRSIPSSLTGSP